MVMNCDRKPFGSRRKNSKSCSDDWHHWRFWSMFWHFRTHLVESFRMSKSSWMMDPIRSREMPNCSAIDLAEIQRFSKISSWIWSIISRVVILGRPGQGASQVEKSPRLNWATQFLTVAYNGACSPNVSVRMTWISFGTLPRRKKKSWWQLVSRCCWNRARRLTCFLSSSVTRKDNSAYEQTPLSNDTIDSVLWQREVGQAKDLAAALRTTQCYESTVFPPSAEAACSQNGVSYILFTVTTKVVQNWFSDISHVTTFSKNFVVQRENILNQF